MGKKGGARKRKGQDDEELVNLIFSWSLQDVANQHLFKDKVSTIPDRFFGLKSYLDSFRAPLLEEIRAEMSSSLEPQPNGSKPVAIRSLVSLLPKGIKGVRITPFYRVTVSGRRGASSPCIGDIVVLSVATPLRPSEHARDGGAYCLAHVKDVTSKCSFVVRAARIIEDVSCYAFVASLLSFIPYARIWRCLNYEAAVERNSDLVKVVAGDNTVQGTYLTGGTGVLLTAGTLSPFGLNDSQTDAVLSCVSAVQCGGASSKFSLIWGPPGTGKTKTISVLLLAVMTKSQSKCRVLTCAPTNTAVCQVASRLLALRKQHPNAGAGGCHHGDLLLFGNKQRMAIDKDLTTSSLTPA